MTKKTRTRKNAAPVSEVMETAMLETMTPEAVDAEIAALQVALMGVEGGEEIVPEPSDALISMADIEELSASDIEELEAISAPASDTELEAIVGEAELEEAKVAAYAEQPGSDMSTEPVVKREATAPVEPKTPRVTMTGAKKSAVATSKLGDDVLLLELSDASESIETLRERSAEIVASFDKLAKKVGEKAVNIVGALKGTAKLSVYTSVALRTLTARGSMTAADLIKVYQDGGYSKGTANSQAHQMMQLLPVFKAGTLTGKLLTRNDNSVLIGMFGAEKE
jgi:hypothetical protein